MMARASTAHTKAECTTATVPLPAIRSSRRQLLDGGAHTRLVRLRAGCYGARFVSRSAMRVCQPGPLAFQWSKTVSGRRMVTCFLGFVATGRPARFTTPRLSMSSVSSGSSSNSLALIRWAATRLRSDFKVRADAGLFTGIGFPHAEDMAGHSALRVTNYNQTIHQIAKADYSDFAIVLASVLNLKGDAGKH